MVTFRTSDIAISNLVFEMMLGYDPKLLIGEISDSSDCDQQHDDYHSVCHLGMSPVLRSSNLYPEHLEKQSVYCHFYRSYVNKVKMSDQFYMHILV